MMKRLLLAVILSSAAFSVEAQPMPPGKWWQRPEMVKRLEISDEQQSRLDAVHRGAAPELIDARAAVDKLAIQLRTELDQPRLDRGTIQKVALRLNEARGKLFERELMMLVDMQAVLNQSQWTRLRTMLDRAGQARRPAGRPPRPHRP